MVYLGKTRIPEVNGLVGFFSRCERRGEGEIVWVVGLEDILVASRRWQDGLVAKQRETSHL